mgnify:CR=1 FL=1
MKNLNRPAPLCGVSCKRLRRPCKTVQSTHPRGVRHLFEHGHQLRQIISTHAPREGCDLYRGCLVMSYFSLFQSPHPVRGATGSRSCWPPSQCHFNPRTPRGVRLIRSARVASNTQGFQSTHPARGATVGGSSPPDGSRISIHAPREGCDWVRSAETPRRRDFNPRTPRGVRLSCIIDARYILNFNPRTPRGVRPGRNMCSMEACDFNPRTPRGVRPQPWVIELIQ